MQKITLTQEQEEFLLFDILRQYKAQNQNNLDERFHAVYQAIISSEYVPDETTFAPECLEH